MSILVDILRISSVRNIFDSRDRTNTDQNVVSKLSSLHQNSIK